MNNKLYRLGIIWLSLIVSLVLYQIYIVLASPQVPYMDTMLFFVQIDQILKGEISWLDVYGSGEHRGLIYPFLTFIEWTFWGVDARISTVMTGFVVSVIFFYWLSAYLNAQANTGFVDKKTYLWTLVFCLMAAGIIVSPAGFELWTLDLGFAQLFKNLLIIHFLYLLAINKCWAKTLGNAFIIGIYGALLILVATYGWSYPFLIACLFALICSTIGVSGIKKYAVIVAVFLLVAQAIYIYSGHGMFSGTKPAGSGISILGLVGGVLYGAGTTFIGSEVIGKLSLPLFIPLILGIVTLVVALLALLITLLERTKEKIFLSSLLVFALMVLMGVAVARGSTDFVNTGASRYFVDYIWLLLAPVAVVFTTRRQLIHRNIPYQFIRTLQPEKLLWVAKMASLFLVVAAFLGHLATWYVELKTAPYRAVIFSSMANVYRNGVDTEADASLLQSPFSVAKQAIVVAQSYNLSVLRNDGGQCTLTTAEYTGDWYSVEQNATRWMGKKGSIAIRGCSNQVTIKGFIPEYFSSRELLISYGSMKRTVAVEPGKEVSFVIDLADKRRIVIQLELDVTTMPANIGLNTDTRELGLLLTYIGK